METCKIHGTTQPFVSRTGAGRQENIFSFQSREKNVLDFSSYRSGFYANYKGIVFVRSRKYSAPADNTNRNAAGPIPLKSPTRRCDRTAHKK